MAITFVPADLAADAAAIAVLSSPPMVCTPSESSTITFGTPVREPAPVTAACPASMPPERNVWPPAPGAASSASRMADKDDVRFMCVTTEELNSTHAICASASPTSKLPTILRAKESTSGRCAPTLPELSVTIVRSTATEQGGGATGGSGGNGGGAGGIGTGTPHSSTASTCSYPDACVVIFSMAEAMLPSKESVSADPHAVASMPCQRGDRTSPYADKASTRTTKGALYVS